VELGERPSDRTRERKRIEAEQRQIRSRQRKAQQDVVDRLESEIATLEQRQTDLTAELEAPETYDQPGRAAEITRELAAAVARLKGLTLEWEAAASMLAELER
jgi:ATP-binding cassette subfamily F protein 3